MGLLDRAVSATLPWIPRPVVRQFSRRYIAGTTMDQAFAVVRDLVSSGAMTTLDILGEFVHTTEETRANTRAYQDLVTSIRREGLPETNVSVKLTALGLLLDTELCLENMRALLECGSEWGAFVRIDMEDSSCTEPTIRIYERLREEFPGRVGVVLQSYMRRTLADVDRLTEVPGTNFRLCKGIYVEPEKVAYQGYQEVRDNFVAALERMLDRGSYVGIATHDSWLIDRAVDIVRRRGLDRTRYEFQMLLGVEERQRRRLIDDGHRLRVYVPYGEHWYSYSLRRLRENPRIAGYAFKALFTRS